MFKDLYLTMKPFKLSVYILVLIIVLLSNCTSPGKKREDKIVNTKDEINKICESLSGEKNFKKRGTQFLFCQGNGIICNADFDYYSFLFLYRYFG
jgi:hypothetical protein